MPRLFVGLELPEAIRERLARVKGPLPGARWIEPDDLHMTLRFAGDIDNPTADELVGFLASIEIDPFEVRITGLDASAAMTRAPFTPSPMADWHSTICRRPSTAPPAPPEFRRSREPSRRTSRWRA